MLKTFPFRFESQLLTDEGMQFRAGRQAKKTASTPNINDQFLPLLTLTPPSAVRNRHPLESSARILLRRHRSHRLRSHARPASAS